MMDSFPNGSILQINPIHSKGVLRRPLSSKPRAHSILPLERRLILILSIYFEQPPLLFRKDKTAPSHRVMRPVFTL